MNISFITQRIKAEFAAPDEHQNNFKQLYFDIAWFGLLNGSILTFLSIFVTRLGGTGLQVGLVTAIPALVNLVIALPAGLWIKSKNIVSVVFSMTLVNRLFYVLIILSPFLFPANISIWIILAVLLVMNIPGTAGVVGFNALFAESVPSAWRGQVSGIRNAILSLASIATILVSGQVLHRIVFPGGYQLIFFIGLVGAVFSSYQLKKIQLPLVEIGAVESESDAPIIRKLAIPSLKSIIRADVLKTEFKTTLLILFFFHFFMYLALVIFPIYYVNVLKFTDQILSIGNGIVSVAIFISSMQLARFTRKLGNRGASATGIIILAFFPILLAFIHTPAAYYLFCMLGGFGWALAGGALYNYLLDKVPENDRPTYFGWSNIATNAGILIGSIAGPIIAGWTGFFWALIIFGLGRAVTGYIIYRRG